MRSIHNDATGETYELGKWYFLRKTEKHFWQLACLADVQFMPRAVFYDIHGITYHQIQTINPDMIIIGKLKP